LPRQSTDSAAPNAKEQKMENVLLLLLLLCSLYEGFFRITEAVILALLQSNQIKQRERKKKKKGRKKEKMYITTS
jgi:hypothetical protein